MYDIGQVIPISIDGPRSGTVTVNVTRTRGKEPATTTHIAVAIQYVATGTFPLSAGQWELVRDDGSSVPLVAADPKAAQGTLQSGDRLELKAGADLPDLPADLFVVYVDVVRRR